MMTAHADALAPTANADAARALDELRRQAPRLRALGVKHLSLFGSLARGEAGPESDIDLLIEVDPSSAFSLFDIVDLQDDLTAHLGRQTHFAFATTMRPWLRAAIQREAIEVF
jgi:predicted nucleotidyltransferase